MSEARIQLDAQVQIRRDIEANWITVDPVLRDGELAYSRDINRIKIGDGAHKWSELTYMLSVDVPGGGGGDVNLEQIQEILDQWKAEVIDPMWQLVDGDVVTDKQVIIKKNLIVEGDTGSGGEGEDTPSAGLDETRLQEYLDEHKYVTEDDIAELIPSNIATVDYVNTKFNSIDLSPYATTTELNVLANRVTSIETWMDNVGQHITYDAELDAIVINHNLIVTKDTSSGGEGEDTPASGGIRGIYVNNVPYTDEDGDGFIDLGTISGGVSEITASMITSALGYTPANGKDYLPLAGGTIESTSTSAPLIIKTASNGWLMFRNTAGYLGEFGFSFEKIAHCTDTDGNARTLIHSGNIGSYALPLSGGVVNSTFILKNNSPIYSKYANNSTKAILGIDGSNNVILGWEAASSGSSTYIDGVNVYLRYGISRTNGLILNSSGNVLIGTTTDSGSRLTISNPSSRDVLFLNSNASQGPRIYLAESNAIKAAFGYDGTYKVMWFENTSTSAGIYIHNNGNIGIGTTSPAYKLDVDGTFNSNALRTDSTTKAFWGHTDYYGILSWDTTYASVMAKSGLALRLGVGVTPYITIASNGAVTMSSTLTVGGNITPSIHNAYSLGVYNKSFVNIHSNIILSGANDNNLWLVGGAYNSSIGIQFARNATGDNSGKMGSWDATGLYPATNNTYTLGTNSNMWKVVYTPLLQSAGGLDIVANGGGTASRLWLTTNCFRPWSADAGLIDLGLSSIQWRNVYAVNGIFSGDTSSGSDIRFKDIIKNKTLKIEHIAKAPLFTFKWNDRDDDSIHLGSSAQYWEKVCPWLVTGEDFKSLNYATLGVAMGISLAKKAVNHEARIKELEKEIKRLKEEMRYGDR